MDVDGTLIDSIGIQYNALVECLKLQGEDTMPSSEQIATLTPYTFLTNRYGEMAGSIYDNLYRPALSRLLVEIRPFSGCIDFLRHVAPFYLLGAVSSALRWRVEALHNCRELFSMMQVIVCADGYQSKGGQWRELPAAFARHKPFADPIHIAITSLEVASKDCTLMGDSTEDIFAGKNTSIKIIGVSWGSATRLKLESAGANRVVDSFSELEDLLVGKDEN